MECRIATADEIRYVCDNMRESDRQEIWASHRHTPEDVVMACAGIPVFVAICDKPFVIFGVSREGNVGVPWLLATPEIKEHFTYFLKQSRRICDEWLKEYGVLTNFMHESNTECFAWLRWLKFGFVEARYFNGERFIRFEKRWQDV